MFGLNTKTTTLSQVAITAMTAGFLLAACGGDNGSASTSGGDGQSGQAVVNTSDVSGMTVLVDKGGQTLYFADQDTANDIKCVDGCLGFWFPLTVQGDVTPSGTGVSADKLGTVKRPDNGATQVTYAGKPLYTFKLDTNDGSAKGDGVTDDFNGTTFDWHAATPGGSSSPAPSQSSTSGGGGRYGY